MTAAAGPDPARRRFLQASAAAFRNAVALYGDARLLLKHRRYPRAAALAIIGCEEVGKAIALVLAGLGKIPDAHLPKLLKQLRYGRQSHQTKQAISFVAWLLGTMLAALRHRVRGPRERLSAPATFEEFKNTVAGEVARIAPGMLRVLDRRVDDWTRLNNAVQDVAAGSWQRVRDRALYVDVGEEHVQEPASVKRTETAVLVDRLGVVLRGFRPLLPLAELSDEAVAVITGALPSFDQPADLERLWREAMEAGEAGPAR